MDAQYSRWVVRWQAALDACQRKGGESRPLVIAPPALLGDIDEIEKKIGHILPTSFRQALTDFSADMKMSWFLPEDCKIPEVLRHISCSDCDWGLSSMMHLESYQLLFDASYDPNDSFDDALWHDKPAFMDVGNGDIIAFDLKFMPDPPVVYLSHDGGEGHGYRLGSNFTDFMERWSLLGCPGSEDWQIMPFLPDATSGLDVYGENARSWREWLGLDFDTVHDTL